MKTSRISILLIIIAVIFVFTACTSEENIKINDNDITVIEESPSTYIPERGGELLVTIPSVIESYNPLLAENEDLINLLSSVYETPLTIDENGYFEPNLIETWSVNEDGNVYTFTARNNIAFHNGNSFTIDDIIYTINLIYEYEGKVMPSSMFAVDTVDDTQSDTADESDITAETSDEKISGENANTVSNTNELICRYSKYTDLITDITKIDDNSVQITMSRPGRECLYFMTFPVLDSETSPNEIIGSGPYKFSEWGTNNSLVLSVNDLWWKTTPYIEKIIAKPSDSMESKTNMYENGEINFISTNSIASGNHKEEGVTQIIDYNTNYYDCIVPNLFNDYLKIDEVRKAISYAINRRDIIASVMLNHAIVAEMPINPNFYAYNVKYKLYEYDENTSKSLLESAGLISEENSDTPVLELTMIVPNEIGYEYRLEVARIIADMLSNIGVQCNIAELSPNDYLTRLNNMDFDLAYCSYYMDRNPDLTFMLGTGAECNYGNVASNELDALLAQCQRSVSETDIIESYDMLQHYFSDKIPQIGLFYRTFSVIAADNIKDISGMYENTIFASIHKWSIDLNI